MPREGGAGSRVPACAHEQPTQPRGRSVPITPGRTPGTSRGSQVVTRNRPPKCAMGTGGWCSYGASDEHQQAQVLLGLARRQLLQICGLDGSRRGCVRVGAMEERKQRRRCRGQNVVDVRHLFHEASNTINCTHHPTCPCRDRRPRRTCARSQPRHGASSCLWSISASSWFAVADAIMYPLP